MDLPGRISLGGGCCGLLTLGSCCCLPFLSRVLGLHCLRSLLRIARMLHLAVGKGLGSGGLGDLLVCCCRDDRLLVGCLCLPLLGRPLSSGCLLHLARSSCRGGARSSLLALRRCGELRLPLPVLSLRLLRILLCRLGLLDLMVSKCLSSSSSCLLALGSRCSLCLLLAGRLLCGVRLLYNHGGLSLGSNGSLLLVIGCCRGQRRFLRVHSLLCLCGLFICLCLFHFSGSGRCLSLRPVDLAGSVSLGGGCCVLLALGSCCRLPLLSGILGLLCLRRLLCGMRALSLPIGQGLSSSGLGHLPLRSCREVGLLLDCFRLLCLRRLLDSSRLFRLTRGMGHGSACSSLLMLRRCDNLRLPLLVLSLCLLRILLCCLGLLDLTVGKCLS